jgi:DNA polymerase-3 subunit epsilon
MFRRWRHRKRCLRQARECRKEALCGFLEACAHLEIGHIDDTPLIAVDFELTGLDRNTDHIIAMGWTLIDHGRIRFGGNQHLLVTAERSVGTSAAIHELMDSEVAEGLRLSESLDALFTAARGRIWVLHHAGLDLGFLRTVCRKWAGSAPSFVVLDTMEIELRQLKRREVPVKPGDLQLGRMRERYGLPRYSAHNALNDALATAELLLAIAARLEPDGPLRLAPHLQYY